MKLSKKVAFISLGFGLIGWGILVASHSPFSKTQTTRGPSRKTGLLVNRSSGPDANFKVPESFKMPKLEISQKELQKNRDFDFSKATITEGKVEINLVDMISRNSLFRDANQNLPAEELAQGRVSYARIILPEGLRVRYGNTGTCRNVASSGDEQGLAQKNETVRVLSHQSTLKSFAESIAKDTCISKATFE